MGCFLKTDLLYTVRELCLQIGCGRKKEYRETRHQLPPLVALRPSYIPLKLFGHENRVYFVFNKKAVVEIGCCCERCNNVRLTAIFCNRNVDVGCGKNKVARRPKLVHHPSSQTHIHTKFFGQEHVNVALDELIDSAYVEILHKVFPSDDRI